MRIAACRCVSGSPALHPLRVTPSPSARQNDVVARGRAPRDLALLKGNTTMSDTQQRSGWVGWAVFAGIVMIIAGAFDALLGLTAILQPADTYFVTNGEGAILLDVAGWGWWHLILGLAIVLVGIFVLRGATWARVIAIILIALNAISQLALLGVQPWWSLIVIALDILVIYALTVHGKELKQS